MVDRSHLIKLKVNDWAFLSDRRRHAKAAAQSLNIARTVQRVRVGLDDGESVSQYAGAVGGPGVPR